MSKYKERLALGLCGLCGQHKEDSTKSVCGNCRQQVKERAKRREQRRKESQLCIKCGIPTPLVMCKSCRRNKNKNRYQKDVAKDPIKMTLRMAAGDWLGKRSRWRELQEKFDLQNGQCHYSGLPIAIRDTAQVDHAIPRNSGGGNVIDNLHWVHSLINKMKADLPEDVFIFLCKAVADHSANVTTPEAFKKGGTG